LLSLEEICQIWKTCFINTENRHFRRQSHTFIPKIILLTKIDLFEGGGGGCLK
jgi:hypothetical protein